VPGAAHPTRAPGASGANESLATAEERCRARGDLALQVGETSGLERAAGSSLATKRRASGQSIRIA
jgi:hypothetical protein